MFGPNKPGYPGNPWNPGKPTQSSWMGGRGAGVMTQIVVLVRYKMLYEKRRKGQMGCFF